MLKTTYFAQGDIFVLLLLFCMVVCAGYAVAEERSDLLRIVRGFDDVYDKNVSSSGRHTSVSSPWGWGATKDRITDYAWFYTQSGSQKAVLEVSKLLSWFDKDDGVLPSRRFLLFDETRSGEKQVTLSPEISIHDYATSLDVRNTVLNLDAPDSRTWRLQTDLFLFALGRGIVKKIELLGEVKESIERNGEMCVLIVGQGGEYLSEKGIWRVYALPHAAYMLRYAHYSHGDEVLLEIETFGLKRNGDCFYPEMSEVRVLPSNRGIVHKFSFSDAKLEFDSELFNRVSREFDADLPEGSVRIDRSSGKDTIQLIGGEEPHEPYVIQPRPFFTARTIFIIVFNLVGIALLIYLYYRSRRINQS